MRRRSLALAAAPLLALWSVTACASTAVNDDLGPSDPPGLIGTVVLTGSDAPPAPPKVIVTSFTLSGAGAVPRPALVAYGSASTPPGASADLRVELVAADGAVLSRREASDPRRAIVENEGYVQANEAVLVVRSPFHPRAESAILRDADGAVLAEADVSDVIRSFCADIDDKECAQARDPRGATD